MRVPHLATVVVGVVVAPGVTGAPRKQPVQVPDWRYSAAASVGRRRKIICSGVRRSNTSGQSERPLRYLLLLSAGGAWCSHTASGDDREFTSQAHQVRTVPRQGPPAVVTGTSALGLQPNCRWRYRARRAVPHRRPQVCDG